MKIRYFLYVALFCGALTAQQKRHEIVNATTPEKDGKPNSPDVPDVYALTSKFDRIVILRFKYDADLLEGLQRAIKQQKIQNGVILSGAGSVRNYQIHTVSNRTFPSKNMYVEDSTAPADMIGMNGYVINGAVHAHITLANPDHAFGGHLERGTTVFTFAIVTVGVFENLDLSKVDDKTYR